MSRRRRCRNGSFSDGTRRSKSTIKKQRRRGWDMNLYRNTESKKIAGVCAGLADHFEVAHWVVRLIVVAGFCFTGSLAIFSYIIAWCLMAPKSKDFAEESVEYDEKRHEYRPKTMFRYSEGASDRLKAAKKKVNESLGRVEDMESYVTSRRYQLNKEFSKLAE